MILKKYLLFLVKLQDDNQKNTEQIFIKVRINNKKRPKKNPYQLNDKDFIKVASTYSPTLKRAVPSAQSGLTSLFGMGRGGP